MREPQIYINKQTRLNKAREIFEDNLQNYIKEANQHKNQD